MLQGEGVPKHLCGLGNKGVRLMSWKFIICHTSLNSPEEGIIVITPAFYPGANWGSERVHQGAGLELWSVWAWSWASQPLSILDCQVQMVSASRASRGRQRPRHHFSSGLVWSGLVWSQLLGSGCWPAEVRQTENPVGMIYCCENSRPQRDICRKLATLLPESSKARWKSHKFYLKLLVNFL